MYVYNDMYMFLLRSMFDIGKHVSHLVPERHSSLKNKDSVKQFYATIHFCAFTRIITSSFDLGSAYSNVEENGM